MFVAPRVLVDECTRIRPSNWSYASFRNVGTKSSCVSLAYVRYMSSWLNGIMPGR